MVTVVNVHEAKTHLSRLIDRAAAGEEIVVARAGRPVARLVALAEPRPPRVPGQLRGRITFTEDVDETPDWLIEAFEGGEEPSPPAASGTVAEP